MDNLSLPTDDELLPVLREICTSTTDIGCAKLLDRRNLNLAHNRLENIGRPKTEKDRLAMAMAWPLWCLFDYCWAAAQIAGVEKEDIGRQLEAEYGVNTVPFLPSLPTPAEVEERKTKFKIESMEKLRHMLKNLGIRTLISVDAHGEPIWDEAKHGEFCVLVMMVDKGRGLEDFGPDERCLFPHGGVFPLGLFRSNILMNCSI
ncbi:uncharacterized protein N7500_010244 [Penicillium coprophilum]|uniref:uncharacterized protein n=1 Tax=Penicillium coprophilum TaxID=36646 RepID=UPI0023A77EE9|nr:uncharacterized protein N7500_010244 [Penicillium coprophilum]KAJ5154805.1 hypothetical protein N7500_010244 [Penicillium coprophilum]